MRFRQLEKTSMDPSIVYEMEDRKEIAGSFAWHMDGNDDFWIDRIVWKKPHDSEKKMTAVLEFLRYKAGVSGCSNIYIKVSAKNHSLQQSLLNFGFYKIDEEIETGSHGEELCICTLKLGRVD